MKKPTRHRLETLPWVSVKGVRHVNMEALIELFDQLEQDEAEQATPAASRPAEKQR